MLVLGQNSKYKSLTKNMNFIKMYKRALGVGLMSWFKESLCKQCHTYSIFVIVFYTVGKKDDVLIAVLSVSSVDSMVYNLCFIWHLEEFKSF